jgi:protein SCO1/2
MKSWKPARAAQLVVACCAMGLPLHCDAGRTREDAGAGTTWTGGHRYERSVRSYTIPDVVLVDADARPVRLRELLATGDPVMLNFIFTSCNTVCPVMVRVFADLPARLGPAAKDLHMISISIDPDNDTPEQLKAWANHVGQGLRWRLLTGRIESIRSVQLAFDNYRGDKMAHEPLTLIRRGGAKSWLRIDGFASPDELASEYAKALAR